MGKPAQKAPVGEIDLLGSRMKFDPVGTVAIPVRDVVNANTMMSLVQTQWPEGGVDRLIAKGSMITLQRNALINQMRGDWILFIDDDMTWDEGAVVALLTGIEELRDQGIEADVFGALCFRRSHPHQPTLYMRQFPDHGGYNFVEAWDSDIVEVDATGMAFALITKAALERVAGTPMPPFEQRIKYARHPEFFTWQGYTGEDLRFCQDVKKAGGRIFVDTRIHIGHVGEATYGHRDFLRAVMERGGGVTRARKAQNDAMGLPTLTKAEAEKMYREYLDADRDVAR